MSIEIKIPENAEKFEVILSTESHRKTAEITTYGNAPTKIWGIKEVST